MRTVDEQLEGLPVAGEVVCSSSVFDRVSMLPTYMLYFSLSLRCSLYSIRLYSQSPKHTLLLFLSPPRPTCCLSSPVLPPSVAFIRNDTYATSSS